MRAPMSTIHSGRARRSACRVSSGKNLDKDGDNHGACANFRRQSRSVLCQVALSSFFHSRRQGLCIIFRSSTGPMEKFLHDSGMNKCNVHDIVLGGDSTRIYIVQNTTHKSINPQTVGVQRRSSAGRGVLSGAGFAAASCQLIVFRFGFSRRGHDRADRTSIQVFERGAVAGRASPPLAIPLRD